jgi:N-acetyl-anhydromuramyl-L-alanine amidase AmpD
VLGRDGTYAVVAAGRAWHAGAGAWKGVVQGNAQMIGIEAENQGNGHDPWPYAQLDAYHRGVAAILKHIGAPAEMCCAHKEYALPQGRKSDPAGIDMDDFRQAVAALMK